MISQSFVEEFEQGWSKFVEDNKIGGDSWIVEMYKKRQMWAEAFFRKHFSAMTRSTQRAESLNALIKLSLSHRFSITEFLRHYHCTL